VSGAPCFGRPQCTAVAHGIADHDVTVQCAVGLQWVGQGCRCPVLRCRGCVWSCALMWYTVRRVSHCLVMSYLAGHVAYSSLAWFRGPRAKEFNLWAQSWPLTFHMGSHRNQVLLPRAMLNIDISGCLVNLRRRSRCHCKSPLHRHYSSNLVPELKKLNFRFFKNIVKHSGF